MKRFLQLLVIALALGAMVQTVARAVADEKPGDKTKAEKADRPDKPSRPNIAGSEPGV